MNEGTDKRKIKIIIAPVGEISKKVIEYISNQLRTAFSPVVEEVKFSSKIEEVPEKAYNKGRDQYRAEFIQRKVFSETTAPENSKVLGVTMKDLYSKGLNYVFGQAQKPGKVAIISLHRLRPKFWNQQKDKNLFLERAAKEAIHEIGHTLGLNHCDKNKCVMRFSNNIRETDKKTKQFCKECHQKIFSY